MRYVSILFTLLNLGVLIIFIRFCLIAVVHAPLAAEVRFRFLDESGVINLAAVDRLPTQLGFETSTLTYRRSIPLFIADEALANGRRASLLGACVSAANVVVGICVFLSPGVRGLTGKRR